MDAGPGACPIGESCQSFVTHMSVSCMSTSQAKWATEQELRFSVAQWKGWKREVAGVVEVEGEEMEVEEKV